MKRLLLLLFLFTATAHAQLTNLNERARGSFLDSAVIMEEDQSDILGYCVMYETDRKSKEIYQLDYVILDKNLNCLTSFSFTQAVYKTWMARTRAELTFASKIGNKLVIGVNDRLKNLGEFDLFPFFNYRFVDVNLDDFTYSKEYNLENPEIRILAEDAYV